MIKMKIKKQADGKYYEKIVTWKKKPNYFFKVLGVGLFILLFIYVLFMIKTEPVDLLKLISEGQITGFFALNAFLGQILTIVGTVASGIYFLISSIGEEKKIKFKKINS